MFSLPYDSTPLMMFQRQVLHQAVTDKMQLMQGFSQKAPERFTFELESKKMPFSISGRLYLF